MSRVVWDTGKKLKKDVRFEMSGEDTELDRSVIDKLADPLMHMVRNAVDHGVETPDVRTQKGKPTQGVVRLEAYHSGGSIYIEIKDDGKGLNPKKLIEKAREKGVLSEGQTVTDEEALQLIFAAGFSIAEVITDVSGRGVGMDVVRKNIESMRGRVTITSEEGKGSLFRIELPLTLAIMEGVEVRLGVEHFIIPTFSIVEFVRPNSASIVKALDCGETLAFRGTFLPIFRLSQIYGLPSSFSDPSEGVLVVVDHGGKLAAIMVDEVLGKLSAVIKSLGALFQGLKGVSGCAVLPSGGVGLILDVGSLIALARTQSISHPALGLRTT
ncbi:MAG: chemotaxis protein CheA, partial [Bdellovibrionales bacterium]|nr:chemotaxis protein CheA [Bdellovibrionales bacterium]